MQLLLDYDANQHNLLMNLPTVKWFRTTL